MSRAALPTVLLVAESAHVRRLAATLLRGEGFAVLEARTAAEASAIAGWRLGELDLLLTEVSLPDGGAATLAEALTQFRPGLPVLFLSGPEVPGVVCLSRSRHIMPFLNSVYKAIEARRQ
jgi:CheY-like chemotaxis protein